MRTSREAGNSALWWSCRNCETALAREMAKWKVAEVGILLLKGTHI